MRKTMEQPTVYHGKWSPNGGLFRIELLVTVDQSMVHQLSLRACEEASHLKGLPLLIGRWINPPILFATYWNLI